MAEVPEVPTVDPELKVEKNAPVEIEEWLKADERVDARAEAKGTANPTTNPQKRPRSPTESVTIVTGRPSTLSHVPPVPPAEVNLEGKNWIGLLMGMYPIPHVPWFRFNS